MTLSQIIKLLKMGKVGVMPTDTVYGIIGSALNPQTVEEIYRLRKRASDKPMIVLISSIDDTEKFFIKLTKEQEKVLEKIWPNPVSVVLPLNSEKFKYLHRGKNSLAFRIPKSEMILKILKKVGPIVAPSANYEGEKPSESIEDAEMYFGKEIAFYVDGGKIISRPSTIVKLSKEGYFTVLREGVFDVRQIQLSG